MSNTAKKIVFLGLAESGKSTIIDSVIEGKIPQLGGKYDATINYQRKIKMLCGIEINIFDLGGQTRFLDRWVPLAHHQSSHPGRTRQR